METNEITQLASKYINNTNRNIFLTGKAGTGKTTFLRHLVDSTFKNTMVAAPTGIAAINAKGVTLHSLFQLPFGSFIPENIQRDANQFSKINTPESVLSNLQMYGSKRNLLKAMELLVIDEVSMLRADLLDCIDTVLRHVRKKRDLPFGGVQILFIGDLLQLPPVVNDSEWGLLSKYYPSPFFFDAQVLKNNPPIYIELEKVFRQSNDDFLNILNNLRHNKLNQEDLNALNTCHKPDFNPNPEDGFVHITTHNKLADKINQNELGKIKAKEVKVEAVVSGDFDERIFPVEDNMKLKVGSQVMFIKNDPTGEKEYYNGKIGTLKSIDLENNWIKISCKDDEYDTLLEPYKWENSRYSLNTDTNQIDEKIIGTFTQFPIRLSWAITVHKSQGLTFEKAILDLSQCFAPGQMYVALSRLTDLKGLVLAKPITPLKISGDGAIEAFSVNKKEANELKNSIEFDAKSFHAEYITNAFDFSDLVRTLSYHVNSYDKGDNRSTKQKHFQWANDLLQQAIPFKEIGQKFCSQVKNIISKEMYLTNLAERVKQADAYFSPLLISLMNNVDEKTKSLDSEKGVKAYLKELNGLKNDIAYRNLQINKVNLLIQSTANNEDFTQKELRNSAAYQAAISKPNKKPKEGKSKTSKTNTKVVSLEMFNEGHTIEEIATKRGFVSTTIEGHLSYFVENGALDIDKLLSNDKLNVIMKCQKSIKEPSFSAIKEKLDDNFSYGEIKLALAHIKWQNTQKT